MSQFNVWSYLARLGVGVRGPGHESLQEGDRVAGAPGPALLTQLDVEELLHVDYAVFSCQAPGCSQTFSQLLDSETHYNAVHKHCCSVCKKSLPSSHLLELHIQEAHDSFFSVLSERKASYQCFLPTCGSLSWNPQDRHDHAVSVHKFPPDFRFDQVKKNPKKKSQKKKQSKKMEVEMIDEIERKDVNMSIENNGNGVTCSEAVSRRPLSLARLGQDQQCRDANGNTKLESRSATIPAPKPPAPASLPPAPDRTSTSPELCRGGLGGKGGRKSRIPVRSSSCRVPSTQVSFGAGVPRAFTRPRKHWHQAATTEIMDTQTNIDQTDLNSLRNALPDIKL